MLTFPTGASVKGLFASCGPTAVIRRIVAIIVDAIERVFWRWARPHVAVKRHEVIAPTLADIDTPTAVIGVIRSLLVEATRLHASPCLVFWRLTPSLTLPVPERPRCQQLASETAATVGLSISETAQTDDRDCPAIALTLPSDLSLAGWKDLVFGGSHSYEFAVALSSDIGAWFHAAWHCTRYAKVEARWCI